MKNVELMLDHVGLFTVNKEKTASLLRNLGFVFGSSAADKSIHVMFKNAYMELLPIPENGSIPVAKPGLYVVILGTDMMEETYGAFKESGQAITEPDKSSRRAKHGANRGEAEFWGARFEEKTPFEPWTYYGFVQHMTPELIYSKERFLQVNDVTDIHQVIFVCADPDGQAAAKSQLEDKNRYIKNSTGFDRGIKSGIIISPAEYEALFGIPYDGGKAFDLSAVVFGGGDVDYVRDQLTILPEVKHFEKDGRLYVDMRDACGCFFVF